MLDHYQAVKTVQVSPETLQFILRNLHFTPTLNSYFIYDSSTILKCQGSILVCISLSDSAISRVYFLFEYFILIIRSVSSKSDYNNYGFVVPLHLK